MKKVLVLEGEPQLGKKISEIVCMHDQNACVFQTSELAKAYQIVMSHDIELMIVDVVLNKGNPEDILGLKFVADVREMEKYGFVPIIVLSALSDEKLHVYSDLHCYGFLEKPFSTQVFSELVRDALRFRREERKRIFIHFRQGGIIYPVRIKDIVFIEHKRRKMYVHTKDEEIEIPYHTCKQTLSELEEYGFVLCARGIVVNLDYIYALDTANHFVVLKESLGCLEMGRKYSKKIKDFLNQRQPI